MFGNELFELIKNLDNYKNSWENELNLYVGFILLFKVI